MNLALQFYALSCLLAAFALTSTNDYARLIRTHPWPLAVALGSMLLLTVHHLWFSISRDSSFSVSLVLASLPAACLLSLLLGANRVYRLVFWMVAACVLYAVVDFLVSGTRAYFPLADPNNFVTLVYLAWIPWLHQQLLDQSPGRFAPAVIGVFSFAFGLALLATDSRFAMFVLLVCAVYWWLGYALARLNLRKLISATVGVVFAGGLFFGVNGEPTADLADVAQEIQAVTETQADGAMVARLAMLESAWQLIVQHGGWLGTGVYTFSLLYPGVRSVLEQGTAGVFVHNDYVQLLLEGGVLLSIPLAILLVWVAAIWISSLLKLRIWSAWHGYLVALCFALMHAMVNFTLYILPVAFLMGVVLANVLARETESESESETEGDADRMQSLAGKQVRPHAAGLRIALLAGGLWTTALLGLDAMTYAVFSGQQGVPFSGAFNHSADAQRDYAETAIRLNPDRGIPQYALARLLEADTLENGADIGVTQREIRQAYQRAVSTDPYNPQLLHQYAAFLRRAGDLAAAEELLREAVALNPADADIALSAMDLALAMDDQPQALELAGTAMRWCELLARRDPAALDRLGRGVRQLLTLRTTSDHQQALDACRVHRKQTRATQRESVWLMRLFNP